MTTTDWRERVAIQWRTKTQSKECSIYWEQSILDRLSPINPGKVSYHVLLRVVRETVHQVKSLLRTSSVATNEDESNGAINVVVAIPEGPMLPLAIFTVHLLNHPFNNAQNEESLFTVLVPMDPEEGRERLSHILTDCQPSLILSCRPVQEYLGSVVDDWTKLENVLSNLFPNSQQQGPLLVDFAQLVSNALDTMQNKMETEYEKQEDDPLFSSFWQSATSQNDMSRRSHIVYTSGSTGIPKGCISSNHSLVNYMLAKNKAHGITDQSSIVLLASSLSFDPCLSDILATFHAKATLIIPSKQELFIDLVGILLDNHVTHVLCTPTLWSTTLQQGEQQHEEEENYAQNAFSQLQVVALGGEAIPNSIVQQFARRSVHNSSRQQELRLFATYGVTEACVYQTMGEVFCNNDNNNKKGQCVGVALDGIGYRICQPSNDATLTPCDEGVEGEIVLYGSQIDEHSGYLKRRQEATSDVGPFITTTMDDNDKRIFYKTGDLGYIHPKDKQLYILGRLSGNDGMIKVNGIRVEICEIENSIVDGAWSMLSNNNNNNNNNNNTLKLPIVVVDCFVVFHSEQQQIIAYCILSQTTCRELDLDWKQTVHGIVISPPTHVLGILLRRRCRERLRPGTMPSVFILISRAPLLPTGKCNRKQLPPLKECIPLDDDKSNAILLQHHGRAGPMVAETIIDCLNLQPSQQSMLTTEASLEMLGGDSLSATRIVRTLYARHFGVDNTRHLGGPHGILEDGGPAFSILALLRTPTLGQYVDFLDSHQVCSANDKEEEQESKTPPPLPISLASSEEEEAHEALLQAIMADQESIAIGLLHTGLDPNFSGHDSRLSKVSSRLERKKIFKSNPLHLACSKGMPLVVQTLLEANCKFNTPDASGTFPLHLAAAGGSVSTQNDEDEEDKKRTRCVQLLLDYGAPLMMRDGNKQTVLHSAARGGHCRLIKFLVSIWEKDETKKHGGLDLYDRWFRTPVHWAVLNGKVNALGVLIEAGCNPDPEKPRSRAADKQTSVAMESPLEMCLRLFPESTEKGLQMRDILHHPMKKE